uniref:Coiled-coil domain-containing protein 39 n=1 Tax=Varanus komodoensis TaxID=61221 RepID=A0A8D2Q437_VARKO
MSVGEGSGSAASVLAELDWDDGFAIPVASAENKALEDELQKLQKEKANLQNQLTDYEDRIAAMTSHLKNVRQEFNLTQSLFRARQNEIETEQHFKALAEREVGRLKSEIQRLENEMVSLREKKNSQENNIFKVTQKLEALRCQMNWDQQALEAWLEESARKDNDAVTLQKYTQQDDGKLRMLTLQIEMLTLQCNHRRKILDNELTETLAAQIELDKTAEDFRRVHHERQELIRQWESTIEQMQKRDQEIDKCALDQNDSLTNKLKFMTNQALTLEEKASRMEELLKEKEKNVKEAQAVQLRDTHFKKTKELNALKENEKCVTAEIDGRRGQIKNLHSRLIRVDAETLKQQELMYNQDFYIQQVERRLSRLQGELNTDERQVLEAKVAELTKIADEKKQAYNILQAQQKKLQNDIHFIKLAMNKTGEEMAGLSTRVDELNLFTDKSEKLLKKARADKQDLMIEDNLLKLELKRVRDTLYNKAENVLSLEKRKQQLKTAMEERTADIKVHKAMLETQMRIIEQERQTLSFEFHERLSKIEKLKSRYEIVTVVMMPPEGEEEKTHTYYVIKAAQEKEDLQREGDTLDAKIQQAEKECVALENTLHVLNSCNSNYRNSFKKVTEKSEEHGEKVKLEEEKRAADEKYRYKRRQIKELQEDIQSMQGTQDMLMKDEALINEKIRDKQARISRLTKEIDDQKPKLERVTKQVSRLSREIRALKNTQSETHEEHDIEFRALKDFSRSIDKMLIDISETNILIGKLCSMHILFISSTSSHPSLRSSAHTITFFTWNCDYSSAAVAQAWFMSASSLSFPDRSLGRG